MSLSKQPKHNTNPYKKYGIDNIVFNAGATEHLVVEPDSGEVFGLRKMNKNGTKSSAAGPMVQNIGNMG